MVFCVSLYTLYSHLDFHETTFTVVLLLLLLLPFELFLWVFLHSSAICVSLFIFSSASMPRVRISCSFCFCCCCWLLPLGCNCNWVSSSTRRKLLSRMVKKPISALRFVPTTTSGDGILPGVGRDLSVGSILQFSALWWPNLPQL